MLHMDVWTWQAPTDWLAARRGGRPGGDMTQRASLTPRHKHT